MARSIFTNACPPELKKGRLSDMEGNLTRFLAACTDTRTLGIRVEPFEFEIFCVAWEGSSLEVHFLFKTERAQREQLTRALFKKQNINLAADNSAPAAGPRLVAILPRIAKQVAALLVELFRTVYQASDDAPFHFMVVLMQNLPDEG